MSGGVPSLKPYYGRPWTEWLDQLEKKLPSLSLNEKVEKNKHPSVSLLPRKDILLYGSSPKMDVRVLCQCERCGKLLMPISYVMHMKRHGSEGSHQPAPIQSGGRVLLIKKKYPHSKSKKKINQPPVPPPPLFQSYEAPVPASPIQAPAAISAAVTTTTNSGTAAAIPAAATAPAVVPAVDAKPAGVVLQPVHAQESEHEVFAQTPSAVSPTPIGQCVTVDGNGNGKHRKSKKSPKKVRDFDPNKHCGVLEGNRGPCLRSITCSNHMIHLRKAVPGRSKDLHQLIADHKASKDREQVKTTQVPNLTKSDVGASVPVITSSASSPRTVSPSPTTAATTATTVTTTATTSKSPDLHVIAQPLHISVSSAGVGGVYMPISPVAVVSPIQYVQLGGPMLRVASTQPIPLRTQPLVVTIPMQNGSVMSQYQTHPKPLIMPSCATRKIGGSLVLHNQRIDRQRGDIQAAIARRSLALNSCSVLNTHHKPNILKNSALRGAGTGIRVGVKRQSSEKINDNNKHVRLNDVNGFILHADVSETAEAPQTNNSIHEKVTFINMK